MPRPADDDPFLTVAQVAEWFAVHPETIRRWHEKKFIVGVRTPGGHRRFRLSEVEACLARYNQPEPAE